MCALLEQMRLHDALVSTLARIAIKSHSVECGSLGSAVLHLRVGVTFVWLRCTHTEQPHEAVAPGGATV